eukprot:6209692-Alexandrium_andersonii.AAC.1
MSASLVGSEMCIRDSFCQLFCPLLGVGSLTALLAKAQGCGALESSTGAVSYTHLTLPTICSV